MSAVTMGAMQAAIAPFVDQIKSAVAEARPLRFRGGGTKDFYGQALLGEILDTRSLNQVVAYEPSELVVTVGAGTPLRALEDLLAQQHQSLAFEPPHFGAGATVGGMVAAGLSGPARSAVGSVRDYVLGAQMINGQGQSLRFGGQVMKNVAGYDVSRLLVGSMGILGLVTEVSLKVLPRPVAQATLRFTLDQGQALESLRGWAARPLPVNASFWQGDGASGQLALRLRGAHAAVQAACRDLGGERLDAAAASMLWSDLLEQKLGFFSRAGDECLWRLSVPDATPALAGLPGQCLVEWGGAVRWHKAPVQAMAALRAAAAAVGGTASVWHHPVSLPGRVADCFHPLAATSLRIQRELKRQFDPAGIFNPGRMFADF